MTFHTSCNLLQVKKQDNTQKKKKVVKREDTEYTRILIGNFNFSHIVRPRSNGLRSWSENSHDKSQSLSQVSTHTWYKVHSSFHPTKASKFSNLIQEKSDDHECKKKEEEIRSKWLCNFCSKPPTALTHMHIHELHYCKVPLTLYLSLVWIVTFTVHLLLLALSISQGKKRTALFPPPSSL